MVSVRHNKRVVTYQCISYYIEQSYLFSTNWMIMINVYKYIYIDYDVM